MKNSQRIKPFETYMIKFIESINIVSSGCWEWNKSVSRDGYSASCYKGKQLSGHILSMILFNRYEQGLYVDHKCRNRLCVNPNHLRMVTPRMNVIENNSSPAFVNANKTYCQFGHPFNEKNTGKWVHKKSGNMRRTCLECKRIRREKYKTVSK